MGCLLCSPSQVIPVFLLGFPSNVSFQKISMPTLWRVIGNSVGVGGFKSQRNVAVKMEFSEGWCGGSQTKNPLWGVEGGMDIFWNNTIPLYPFMFLGEEKHCQ